MRYLVISCIKAIPDVYVYLCLYRVICTNAIKINLIDR